MERKNIITGAVLVTVFLILGAYLETQIEAGLLWKTSARHGFWKMAHIHGLGFGFLNIFYGLLLKNYGGGNKLANIGGYLAIIGSFLPVALFLAGINSDFKYLAPAGGMGMVAAWVVMTYTLLTKK